MADPEDPLDPEAWFGAPGVCGSCVAWKPTETGDDEVVAIGLCRLRPEMRRVPANLAKCPKYNKRGGFTYKPSAIREPTRRKRASQAVIKRRNEAGELVDVTPAPRPRAAPSPRRAAPSRAAVESARASGGPVEGYVVPPEPEYRPFPPPAEPPPRDVDLGELTAPLVEAALVELVREQIPGRQRDMHGKYRHGGKVTATDAEGRTRSVSVPKFFAWVEGFAKSLDALEEAIDTHPSLGSEALELSDQVRKMRGSFTTFNVLFSDRSDFFSGKG